MRKMAKKIIRHLFTYVIENKKKVTPAVFRDHTLKVILAAKKRHSKAMIESFAALNYYFGNDFYAPLCRTIAGRLDAKEVVPKECPADKELL